jgi:hypothetical protein
MKWIKIFQPLLKLLNKLFRSRAEKEEDKQNEIIDAIAKHRDNKRVRKKQSKRK